jgi:hypothetical protein
MPTADNKTTHCVDCKAAPSQYYCGHVVDAATTERVLAGWCKGCWAVNLDGVVTSTPKRLVVQPGGFVGAWEPLMGKTEVFSKGDEVMNREFEVHMLNESGRVKAAAIASAFDECMDKLLKVNPEPSREMSIARTKLEEACFFAKKAMASRPENTSG